MSILDDARALQSRKRTDRLLTPTQKKIRGATYLGKDPIDGTDIVQVDGDEPVSGFRLISNNPISIGDRVSLRPSQGGLQRVDAPNVKPDNEVQIEEIEPVFASLSFMSIRFFGTPEQILALVAGNIDKGGLLKYEYDAKTLRFIRKGRYTDKNNTQIPPNTVGSTYEADFSGENNSIIFAPPQARLTVLCAFAVFFPQAIFGKILADWVGDYFDADFDTAPLEVDVSVNGITLNLDPQLRISEDTVIGSVVFDGTVSLTNFSFRFRKRGSTRWFSLK